MDKQLNLSASKYRLWIHHASMISSLKGEIVQMNKLASYSSYSYDLLFRPKCHPSQPYCSLTIPEYLFCIITTTTNNAETGKVAIAS